MPTLKTMRVNLRPCEKTEFGYRLTIGIGRDIADVHNFEFEVSTPDELDVKLAEIFANTPWAADTALHVNNAWYVTIKPANGRWAPGWKARFESYPTVAYSEIAA